MLTGQESRPARQKMRHVNSEPKHQVANQQKHWKRAVTLAHCETDRACPLSHYRDNSRDETIASHRIAWRHNVDRSVPVFQGQQQPNQFVLAGPNTDLLWRRGGNQSVGFARKLSMFVWVCTMLVPLLCSRNCSAKLSLCFFLPETRLLPHSGVRLCKVCEH